MRDQVQANNKHAVAYAAHKLKGSSGVMGAVRLSALCQQLETRAEAGEQGLEPLVADIATEFQRVMAALERLPTD